MSALSLNFSYYLIAGLFALIPAIIWLKFIATKRINLKSQIFIFMFGVFIVFPILLIHIFFNNFPQYDLVALFENAFKNTQFSFLISYAWVSIIEEIFKQWVVRKTDSKKLIIETINDSIRYSLIAALGFSFAENIFYFYQIALELSALEFFVSFIYRSTFTTCAHLVFSGFFGYYYGIAKFSINIFEQEKWQGKKFRITKFISSILGISKFQAYRELLILKGLMYAIVMHTTFNYLLSLNYIIPAAIFIALNFIALIYLLKNRAGKLVLLSNSSIGTGSSMAKSDQEVVIELLGMWFNQKKFVDVIHICERLLKRDPNNQIVKIFKAKAQDKLDPKSPYQKVFNALFSDKKVKSIHQMAQEKQQKNLQS